MAKSHDNDDELEALQIALVRFQQRAIETGERDLVIFEGRDTAGKDGAIKRIVEHLSIRNTRVVALPKPNERQRSEWYFQRYVEHLPAAGELVIFNRSWYNRAGVERVMDFATPDEQETFLRDVTVFERMLVGSGVQIVKLWLDISRKEQAARLKARRSDPLKALKVSPLDAVAQEKWDAYSKARDEMLTRTHCAEAPWTIVHTDKKHQARSNIMRHLLKELAPHDIAKDVPAANPDVVFPFEPAALTDGRLEH
ncbi:MAG: polyphosphate kinase 2 [Alphaproteobacteria bacterium]|nr:polyphosphate kinase 2 [Alphaproteobacteria bacterium]MBU1515617.1 polyphosphate kinase 2 [Alphaproteobacteria bacterium]MBU2096952.1 polyphosphate kinase 2 [Alphaproteobacteria bacterium]MBU2149607.1 polyphosphate kinase 2 [Alphaproteobacteria bacterium]MBU2305657.1 polyphosphate kinase 2 [Alphaproteobacteria bacterium]